MNLPHRPVRSGAGTAKVRRERDLVMGMGVGPVRATATINVLAVLATEMDAALVRAMATVVGLGPAMVIGLGPATVIGLDRTAEKGDPMRGDRAMARKDRRRQHPGRP